jgi:long-chain acyl-CoA synthetase
MFWSKKIHRGPPKASILETDLPFLLEEGCKQNPNPKALNQWGEEGWKSISNQSFLQGARKLARGLSELSLFPGDRVALLMHSDINFAIADMACLLARLIDVPIDLAQTIENIVFILKHSGAKAIVISNLDLLYQIVPHLWDVPELQTFIIAEVGEGWEEKKAELLACQTPDRESQELPNNSNSCLCVPVFLCQPKEDRPCPQSPQCIQILSLEELNLRTEGELESIPILSNELATIIYTPGETGELQGVMLTHKNISGNALAAFKSLDKLQWGNKETVLSFLPMNHIFARTLFYGHLYYGHSIYFSTPNRVMKHLQEIRPTILATIPLLLDRVYDKIEERALKISWKKNSSWRELIGEKILNWGFNLARKYQIGQKNNAIETIQLQIADRLVFKHWREIFGGKIQYILSGGASLKAEVANLLGAAKIVILQGYGLTETSSVVCVNRPHFNRAGTVGLPIAGVEIVIAPDGEILLKAPYITSGYYHNPQATAKIFDAEGWFHTGDLGKFTHEGLLTITGTKKNLFKLSTGKYVTPLPLERSLTKSPLVTKAIVVGRQRKFCGMLIFPNLEKLKTIAKNLELEIVWENSLKQANILNVYQQIIDEANKILPPWSTVKKFELAILTPEIERQIIKEDRSIDRDRVEHIFREQLNNMYGEENYSQHILENATPRQIIPKWFGWNLLFRVKNQQLTINQQQSINPT